MAKSKYKKGVSTTDAKEESQNLEDQWRKLKSSEVWNKNWAGWIKRLQKVSVYQQLRYTQQEYGYDSCFSDDWALTDIDTVPRAFFSFAFLDFRNTVWRGSWEAWNNCCNCKWVHQTLWWASISLAISPKKCHLPVCDYNLSQQWLKKLEAKEHCKWLLNMQFSDHLERRRSLWKSWPVRSKEMKDNKKVIFLK